MRATSGLERHNGYQGEERRVRCLIDKCLRLVNTVLRLSPMSNMQIA